VLLTAFNRLFKLADNCLREDDGCLNGALQKLEKLKEYLDELEK